MARMVVFAPRSAAGRRSSKAGPTTRPPSSISRRAWCRDRAIDAFDGSAVRTLKNGFFSFAANTGPLGESSGAALDARLRAQQLRELKRGEGHARRIGMNEALEAVAAAEGRPDVPPLSRRSVRAVVLRAAEDAVAVHAIHGHRVVLARHETGVAVRRARGVIGRRPDAAVVRDPERAGGVVAEVVHVDVRRRAGERDTSTSRRRPWCARTGRRRR